jgi:hypothetical protein
VQLPLHAQGKLEASNHPAAVSRVNVPFIGCRSEGQTEPLDTPKGTVTPVPVSGRAAQALAYYGSALDLGVLAPRGWHCLGIYGSGGDFLYVSSEPIDTQNAFAPKYRGFDGPVIEISERHSDQNGDLFDKAQIIARVFPAYKALVIEMMEGYPASEYPFGPYPSDELTYKSDRVVEYRTPALADGLGTHSSLKKNGSPIEGVAILSGEPPDLILLSVRLPRKIAGLTPVIVRQVELEVSRRPR